jgi:hypothetical protein
MICSLGKFIEDWKKRWLGWWSNWTYANVYNWGFGILGLLLFMGGMMILGSQSEIAQTAVKAIA